MARFPRVALAAALLLAPCAVPAWGQTPADPGDDTFLGVNVEIDDEEWDSDDSPGEEAAAGSNWLRDGEIKGMNPPPTQPID